jgi:hypothetical protein
VKVTVSLTIASNSRQKLKLFWRLLGAAVMSTPDCETTAIYFLTILEAVSPRSRHQRVGI